MSNITLSKTEQNAIIIMLKVLMDENLEKILADFLSMCPEENANEFFRIINNMVEEGKTKFNDIVEAKKRRPFLPIMIEGHEAEYAKMLASWQKSGLIESNSAFVKAETTRIKMAEIWWFAQWLDKAVTLLLIEETELRTKALQLLWRLRQIEIIKRTPVNFGVTMGTTWFYDNTRDYIPKELPPKWLRSVYNEYDRKKQYKPERNISEPEDLFTSAAAMEKGIKALQLIRLENPVIDEKKRWLRPGRNINILAAWIQWLDAFEMIHDYPITGKIPLLEKLFSNLSLGKAGQRLMTPFPEIVAEFKNLKLS